MTADTVTRVPGRRGAILRWTGVSLLLATATLILLALNGTAPGERIPLEPRTASPEGAKALVQILRQQGVDIEIAEGHDAALRLLRERDATLVMTSPEVPSDAAIERIRVLAGAADLTVFLTADDKVLRDFALGELSDGSPDGTVSEAGGSDCPAPDFSRVGEIEPSLLFTPDEQAQRCFVDAEGRAALLFADAPLSDAAHPATARVAMLEASELFDNAHLTEYGNAALAFALLTTEDRVVWYLPSPADLAEDRDGTLAALTPNWLTPAILMLLCTAVAAAIWRGRRFGSLVEEQLPVTVRASETMLGRARLAAHSGDCTHAAAALRAGATRRLGRSLGLPHHASAEQLAHAIPGEPELAALLTGPLPTNDAELTRFARALGTILDRIDPMPAPGNPADRTPATDERATP